MRRLRHILQGADRSRASVSAAQHTAMVLNAWWCVRIFYALTFYFAYAEANTYWNLANSGAPLQARWVVAWIPETLWGGTVVLLGYLSASAIGIFFAKHRWVRIIVCVALVQAVGFRYSFGGLNHSSHFWIWVAFCFCFLPNGDLQHVSRSYSQRYRYLSVFWLTLALIALFYSLSGFWKIAAATEAIFAGRIHSFAPTALATIVADKLQQSSQTTLLGEFLIDNPWLGWPAHLWVIFVELFAIVAVFRPNLHRLWGVMLMAFHLGTFALMGIVFGKHILVLTVLFLWSPFAPKFRLSRTLVALPMVGWLFRSGARNRLPAKTGTL